MICMIGVTRGIWTSRLRRHKRESVCTDMRLEKTWLRAWPQDCVPRHDHAVLLPRTAGPGIYRLEMQRSVFPRISVVGFLTQEGIHGGGVSIIATIRRLSRDGRAGPRFGVAQVKHGLRRAAVIR